VSHDRNAEPPRTPRQAAAGAADAAEVVKTGSNLVDTRIFRAFWCQISTASTASMVYASSEECVRAK
jgi:hypothetical protein